MLRYGKNPCVSKDRNYNYAGRRLEYGSISFLSKEEQRISPRRALESTPTADSKDLTRIFCRLEQLFRE